MCKTQYCDEGQHYECGMQAGWGEGAGYEASYPSTSFTFIIIICLSIGKCKGLKDSGKWQDSQLRVDFAQVFTTIL